ncbi:MAG: c-type cytochrome domain-containing protein, partial [Isosphaeraceae bacterium]
MTLCLCSIALGSALLWAGPPSPATEGPRAAPGISVEFNRDIRPILSDHCYQCHGPDSARRKAGLRLDQEASAKAARDGRHAIVAGDLAASELYRRITSSDDDERMPPVKSGKILTKPQLELIGRWIAAGAKWQTHWAFIPPARPAVPSVKRPHWARNPIDTFILARLEREGLEPSSEAMRGILLRRVSLDLTGLPPDRDEILAFENDTVRMPTRKPSTGCWRRRDLASGWP